MKKFYYTGGKNENSITVCFEKQQIAGRLQASLSFLFQASAF